ncbi:uncharacterized protein LOC129872116 isoform X1 [Solanum dulcamara]|uniref:uncharacterized protein LOC129872116 isoform X1 n=1 Tax=Solanum dulcamara TaxID=45834 RepID=UPI002486718E|nr:uncharacterized protein LOC129872116 isoform X1 [Solanum dulcamara]
MTTSIVNSKLKMTTSIGGQLLLKPPNYLVKGGVLQTPVGISVTVRRRKAYNRLLFFHNHCYGVNPRLCSNDGRGEVYVNPHQDVDMIKDSASNTGDGYIALFVRMLGLDHDPLDREQAVIALWKYSLGGKQCVDMILQFPGSVNLTVNLLRSESHATCEAAAGFLRMISSVNMYRELVADSGAIEEINAFLRRSSLSSDVKEQSLCTLWNLSVDEKLTNKIAKSDLLPLLIKFLEDEDVRVKEAAGGVLANLALTASNHNNMIEAGVVPKLAMLLKNEVEGSKVIKNEARNVLLELAKDEYRKILILEEGLLLVPLVGAAAYKSFRPALYSWPSLPDGTKIEQNPKPSRYGASELLLGLNIEDKNANIEEEKMKAMVGRTRQQFLARIGAIETEEQNTSRGELPSNPRFTLLPWIDGVARLALILGLEDESAIARAADAIADASINEHMRVSFKEAGVINPLVRLINHPSDTVKLAVIRAIQSLSISNDVCQRLEEQNALCSLIYLLSNSEISKSLTRMILDILTRILDPSKEMKSMFYNGPVNGSIKARSAARNAGLTGNENMKVASTTSLETANVVDLLDSIVLSRLVDIMRTSSPDLQRKAASILEFAAVIEACMEKILSIDLETGLDAVFQQKTLNDTESEVDMQNPELHALEVEEAGHAISAASRLLTRLLDFEKFCHKVNASHFTKLLRKVLKSDIPLYHKDWVAACLVKLSYLSGPNFDYDNPINLEVTLYETIPRLIEQMKTSYSPEVEEAAVVELNRIISEEVVNSTRAVAAEGGIFPLVKLLENGSERAVEAALAILYNLSMESENHAAIIAAGGVPILRRLVQAQRSHWMRALRLLRTLPT